ncbi:hypothetical protein ACJX0J_035113 [Zea mays]
MNNDLYDIVYILHIFYYCIKIEFMEHFRNKAFFITMARKKIHTGHCKVYTEIQHFHFEILCNSDFSIDQRMLSFLFPNMKVSNTIVARFILLQNKYVGIAVNKKRCQSYSDIDNNWSKKGNGFAYGGTS